MSQPPPYPPYIRSAGYRTRQYLPLASLWRRAGARLIDSLIAWAFGFAVVFPIVVGAVGLSEGGSKQSSEGSAWTTPAMVTFFVVVCVLPFLYEAVLLSVWGQTLGKRYLGLSVVDPQRPDDALPPVKAIRRALMNNVGYQVPVFFFILLGLKWEFFLFGLFPAWIGVLLSYLWAIWDQPLHQSVHDRFAGTVVVDDVADDAYGTEYGAEPGAGNGAQYGAGGGYR